MLDMLRLASRKNISQFNSWMTIAKVKRVLVHAPHTPNSDQVKP